MCRCVSVWAAGVGVGVEGYFFYFLLLFLFLLSFLSLIQRRVGLVLGVCGESPMMVQWRRYVQASGGGVVLVL